LLRLFCSLRSGVCPQVRNIAPLNRGLLLSCWRACKECPDPSETSPR